MTYFRNIALGLSQIGIVRPSYLEGGRSGSEMWQPWIDGYIRAAALRPSVWQDFYEKTNENVQTLMSFIQILHDIFTGRSCLTGSQVSEIDRIAPETIPFIVTYIIKYSRPDRLLPNAVKLSEGPTAGIGGRMSADRPGRPAENRIKACPQTP